MYKLIFTLFVLCGCAYERYDDRYRDRYYDRYDDRYYDRYDRRGYNRGDWLDNYNRRHSNRVGMVNKRHYRTNKYFTPEKFLFIDGKRCTLQRCDSKRCDYECRVR